MSHYHCTYIGIYRPSSHDRKTNIFDNMIYMMGKYSDDLEEIIEERTSSLIEEKQKVDALLERMLPKPVARQLMKGSIPIKFVYCDGY